MDRNFVLFGVAIRSKSPLLNSALPSSLLSSGDPELSSEHLAVIDGVERTIDRTIPDGDLVASAPHRDDPEQAFYSVVRTSKGWTLRIPALCDVRVSPALDEIVLDTDPDGDPNLVAIHFQGLVLALILALGGKLVIHAGAVFVKELNGVVAIAGRSGSGKSTVTALLCAAGYQLVSDDLLRVDFRQGLPHTAGGSPELRLRRTAASIAAAFASPKPSTRITADGRLALNLSTQLACGGPLRAIVQPLPDRTSSTVRVSRVSSTDALVSLSAIPRLEGLRESGVVRQEFQHLADLVLTTPFYRAQIPWRELPTTSMAVEAIRAISAAAG